MGSLEVLQVATLLAVETGSAALFVVDTSSTFEATNGQCVVYTKDAVPGPNRSLLGIAKGEPGSAALMVAFERGKDRLSFGTVPILADQAAQSAALRFPSEQIATRWSFEFPIEAEFYAVLYTVDDPALPLIRKIVASLRSNPPQETTALLTAQLRKHITGLLRNRQSTSEARIAPSSVAAVRRGLKTLSDEWKEESLPLEYERGKPGVLFFKITE